MKFPFLLFSLLFFSGTGVLFNSCIGQPYQWQVRVDTSGAFRFSVCADSIQAIGPDLFAIHLGDESIIIRDSPLKPVSRQAKTRFFSLNRHFFAIKGPAGWQLRSCSSPDKTLYENFEKIEVWRNQVLCREKGKVRFIPEEGEEITADSVHIFPDKIHFFQQNGIIWLDTLFRAKFYRTSSRNRSFNAPYFSYFRNDSSWIPVKGNGLIFKEFKNSFWWNDTCLLDSSGSGVFLQTPSKIRNRIGDSTRILRKNLLCLFYGKKNFLLFSGGQKISIPASLEIRVINDSLCALRLSKSWIIVSRHGNRYALKQAITHIGESSGNLLLVRSGKRWGCTDLTGIIRISCRYDSLLPASMGLIAARLGSQWGFLDQDERIVIQPNFESVQPFRDSVSLVRQNQKWGLLKRDASIILPCEFDGIDAFKGGKWKIKKGIWTGIGLPDGNFLLKPRYSDIIEASSGLFQVEREGKKGLFSHIGKPLLPLEYFRIIPDASHRLLITR